MDNYDYTKKEKIFFDNLWEKYGMTRKYFRLNYIYCGGNKQGRHRNYYMMVFGEPPSSEWDVGGCLHNNHCYCSTKIVEQCFVYNKKLYSENKEEGKPPLEDRNGMPIIIAMGNECIHRECPNHGRTCGECGEPHRNKKDNLCNDCRNPKKCKTCKKKMPKVLPNGKPNPYLRCYTCNKNFYGSRKDKLNRWMNDDSPFTDFSRFA